MATIESLLGLPPEGWQAIGNMDEVALAEYLKDITNIEPRPVAVNIVPKSPDDEEEIEEGKELSALDKLKAESMDPDSPFAKKQKRAKRKKGVTTHNIDDPEFDSMLKDLGIEKPN